MRAWGMFQYSSKRVILCSESECPELEWAQNGHESKPTHLHAELEPQILNLHLGAWLTYSVHLRTSINRGSQLLLLSYMVHTKAVPGIHSQSPCVRRKASKPYFQTQTPSKLENTITQTNVKTPRKAGILCNPTEKLQHGVTLQEAVSRQPCHEPEPLRAPAQNNAKNCVQTGTVTTAYLEGQGTS